MTEGDKNILLPIGNKKQYFGIPLATPSEGDKVALIPIGSKKQYAAVNIGTPNEGGIAPLLSIGNKRQYVAVGLGVVPPIPTGSIAWAPGIAYSWTTENATTPHIKITDSDSTVRVDTDVSASGSSSFNIDKLGLWTIDLYDGTTPLDESKELVSEGISNPCFADSGTDWTFNVPASITVEFLESGSGNCGTCIYIHGTTLPTDPPLSIVSNVFNPKRRVWCSFQYKITTYGTNFYVWDEYYQLAIEPYVDSNWHYDSIYLSSVSQDINTVSIGNQAGGAHIFDFYITDFHYWVSEIVP